MCCDSALGAISRGSSALVLHSFCAGCFQTGNNAEGDGTKRLNFSWQSLYQLVTHWSFTAVSPWPVQRWPWGLVALFYLPCVAAWPLTPTHPEITHFPAWGSHPAVPVNFSSSSFFFLFIEAVLICMVESSLLAWTRFAFIHKTWVMFAIQADVIKEETNEHVRVRFFFFPNRFYFSWGQNDRITLEWLDV